MLNPQWLKTFAALAESGSFTRAAERLDLTQAAVSQHLRHLEDRLGPLLIRRPRGTELTPAGHLLLDYCAEIRHAEARLSSRLAENESSHGEISLISPGSIGLVLYPLLLQLQEACPELVVRHRFAPDKEVLEGVLQNDYELGVLTFKPDDPRVAASHFTEEALELVVPAAAQVTGWDDLVRLGFIDHPDGRAMASRLLCRRFPGNPGMASVPCAGFVNQIGLILEPVARGLGFTVMPRYAYTAFARPETLKLVDCHVPVVDTLWLIHRAEWPLSGRAHRVMAHLRKHICAEQVLAVDVSDSALNV